MSDGSERPDEPVDLSALEPELELRAARIGARVRERISAADGGGEPHLGAAIRAHLARLALPAALAAAASVAALLVGEARRPTEPDAFVLIVLESETPARWIAENRPPRVDELLQLLESAR